MKNGKLKNFWNNYGRDAVTSFMQGALIGAAIGVVYLIGYCAGELEGARQVVETMAKEDPEMFKDFMRHMADKDVEETINAMLEQVKEKTEEES